MYGARSLEANRIREGADLGGGGTTARVIVSNGGVGRLHLDPVTPLLLPQCTLPPAASALMALPALHRSPCRGRGTVMSKGM